MAVSNRSPLQQKFRRISSGRQGASAVVCSGRAAGRMSSVRSMPPTGPAPSSKERDRARSSAGTGPPSTLVILPPMSEAASRPPPNIRKSVVFVVRLVVVLPSAQRRRLKVL